MTTTVVSDSGPLIHLTEAKAIHLLTTLGPVFIPAAVANEVHRITGNEDWKSFVSVKSLNDERLSQVKPLCQVAGLHGGEAEAIVLSESMSGSVLLTDDTAARLYATHLGIEVRGSLGLVLCAVAKKRIPVSEGREVLSRLRQTSLWISNQVFTEALNVLETLA